MNYEKKIQKVREQINNNSDVKTLEDAFMLGTKAAAFYILKLADRHVEKIRQEYNGAPNDFKDGLLTGINSMNEWLHIKFGYGDD